MDKIPPDVLREIRNDANLVEVIQQLGIPTGRRGKRLIFRCPRCGASHAAISPYRNLAHCFGCQATFNPIDLVMAERRCTFLDAVDFLEHILFPRG